MQTNGIYTGRSPLQVQHGAFSPGNKPMPYQRISDLPETVRDRLPKHAQEIYKEAFNSAWDQYADPDERRGDASREETAHKVAWSAVKEKYRKGDDGDWHAR
jgi:cation transport regulator